MTAATPAAAGFWRRTFAWMLDFLVLGTLAALLARTPMQRGWEAGFAAARLLSERAAQALVDGMLDGVRLPALVQSLLHDPKLLEPAASLQAALWQATLPWLLGYALLALGWHVGGELSPWQGSPGKHALGLRVTDLQGRRLSPPRVGLRHVAGLLSWLTLNLGHLLAALPPHRRALHDRIAGARVVRRQASKPALAGDAALPASICRHAE
jgi:uncharacterized RDD family membrane protein YckC